MSHERYEQLRKKLTIDCSRCKGLCCIGLYYMKSDGFPADKPAGTACTNLCKNYQCKIHSELSKKKLKGCMNYDCIGAGQRTAELFSLNDGWHEEELHDIVIEVYHKVFEMHQMLWYLLDAYQMTEGELKGKIEEMIERTDALAEQQPDIIMEMDLTEHRKEVNQLLKAACKRKKNGRDTGTAYYFGHDFKKSNLDGADFSQALMIASNLEGCSLKHANFLAADLRDVNVKNTDLSSCIYLTQMQVNSASGNKKTRLPKHLTMPAAW